MSPSESIKKQLDERGIDYQMHDGGNRVCFNIDYCEQCGDYLKSIDVIGNCVIASQSYLTPEQAIAATVGEEFEMYVCKRCGVAYELNILDKGFGKPRFCPNCGYKEMYQ